MYDRDPFYSGQLIDSLAQEFTMLLP